jgi:hypothetical protein
VRYLLSIDCYWFLTLYYSSCDIPLGEGPVNLNWGSIMKTINENPYEFFREGGWRTFLGGGSAEVRIITYVLDLSLTYTCRAISLADRNPSLNTHKRPSLMSQT